MKTKKNFGKRALSLVLTLLIVIGLVPVSVFSTFAEELPELSVTIDTGDSITLKDADADGYYDISNADELYAFAAIVNGGNTSINGELTADIVVNKNVLNADGTPKVNGAFREWTPIGDSSYGYSGIFDGQNHSVSGFKFNIASANYVGLFGYLYGGTVKNTSVHNSYFYGGICVGGVVGYNESGEVTNCYNTGTVSGDWYVGGVVGYSYDSTIANCYNMGTVIGNECVGGVAGEIYVGTITDCYNTGTVRGELDVGGVVGYSDDDGTITNCYNAGAVSAWANAGGVAGYSNGDGTITNCYNTGTVRGELDVGGVAGYSIGGGTITNCYYSDTACAGGINGEDITGSAEAKTTEQFESGEVAYLLGEAFGQKIGEDDTPVLGGDKVYFGYTDCKATEKIYTNTEAYDEKPSHSWDNGVCTVCEKACEHQWEDGVCTVCEKACEHKDYANGFCTVCNNYEPATYNEETGNYEIGNAGQLYWFAEFVNAGNVSANAELTANIDVDSLSSNSADKIFWVPIGTSTAPFKGKFDGNNKTISGLYCEDKLIGGVGLFGYATDCTIENVGVIDSKFLGANCIGAVVGNLGNNSSIYNCYNSGTYISDGSSSEIGGVIGYMGENNVVENCYNKARVFGSKHGGGIVGYAEKDNTIRECYNAGYITLRNIGGGIVGYAADNNLIIDCYNIAMVEIGDTAGGIAAQIVNSDIENCYSIGSVLSNRNFGGIAGVQTGCTFDNCYYLYDSCPDSPDIYGVESIASGHLEIGELAYNLQGDREDHVWGQKIDSDKYPVIGGDKVYYGYILCLQNANKVYTNSFASDEKPPHNYDNGFCTVCKIIEPATYNEETGNYEIGNAGQLYWFADKVNNDNANFGSANAVLTADIVVNEGVMDENSTDVSAWTPIGSDSNPYTGTFDGNGKTISGLYFNNSGVSYIGLFGYVGENGTVKNIGVINSYFNGLFYVGGVVGYCYNSTIANCYNTGTVIGNECVGGVIGFNYGGGTITNCYNTGTVSSERYVGGVVGQNLAGTTNDCYNTGTVSGSRYVGGVVGDIGDSTIANCYNTGTVIGNGCVGGVVGYNYESAITNCYNTGTVSGEDYVGGVVGYNYESTITNCYNTGTVSGNNYHVGGVVGETDRGGTITNCYNTGTVSGEDYVGGVVGFNHDTTITNCYYSDTTCEGGINGKDITGSAEAKTTEQFESGEVAYLLGEAFGQKIGEDDTPVLGGDKVYFGYDTCDEDVDQVYSNEALSYERLPHVWYDGFCTVCDKVCVHTGGTATCTKHAVCEICGTEYGDLDVNNHVGESTPEFNWFAPSYGSCYVDINLICDDCESSVAYDYGYASVAESAEGTDCLHPGYELYEITFEIDGTSYTDSYKHILKSDNHVGEFENGFCSVCGGFEPAYFNEEEWVYEIGNAGQLYWYAQKLNEENAEISVVLTEDIVIPEDAPNWEPITASYVTFDGQFHTISGINSVHENYTYVGMFGNEVWWYEIKNLHLTDSNFEGSDYVGGLVASMNNGGTVQNCYVTNTTVKGGNDTGTLVGFLGMSNVLNCYVDTDTLVGDFNGYGSIENSYYLAEVKTEDGGKTLEQFKSGEVAYLLQAGIAGEDIYDDEWNYIETIIPEIWGQTIGKEEYPVLGGEKVYLSDGNYYNKANKLAGYTIGLGDKIAVNYYMSLTEKTLSDENAKMVFTVPDTGSTYTVEIPVSEAVKIGDYYVFTCEVAAKEMTSVIKAKFVTSDTELHLEDYTVQQYAEVILSDTTKYAKEQELVKAMLNYGAYAQIYFGYNTESLANSILDEADKVLSDADLSSYEFALADNDANVSCYGSALSLETETAIKCYFIIDGDAEAVTATVNGEKAELKKNGGVYELKISDISAHQLGNMYEIKVGDLTLTYGAFSYGYTAMSSTKDALKNVVKAMYEYNQMAVAYKG